MSSTEPDGSAQPASPGQGTNGRPMPRREDGTRIRSHTLDKTLHDAHPMGTVRHGRVQTRTLTRNHNGASGGKTMSNCLRGRQRW